MHHTHKATPTNTGDVPEFLRVREHVGAEGVDDDLDLAVLDLLNKRPQAMERANRRKVGRRLTILQ